MRFYHSPIGVRMFPLFRNKSQKEIESKTITTKMMISKDTKAIVHSPNGDTVWHFDIAGVLQRDT